jgi:uncharacterized protein YbaR (Trm112 family)
MNKQLLNILICPSDKSPNLDLIEFETNNSIIKSGLLYCTKCIRYYPIINGIPIMVPDIQRDLIHESNFLSKWIDKIPDTIKSNSMPFNIGKINSESS